MSKMHSEIKNAVRKSPLICKCAGITKEMPRKINILKSSYKKSTV
jgi:hypothetical protein